MQNNVNSPEAREEIMACIRTMFGDVLSPENMEAWYGILMEEVESRCEGDYSVCQRGQALCFNQSGETEYYHDGSLQYGKKVLVERISEEEYALAKGSACAEPYGYNHYGDAWFARGSERFLVAMSGRSYDYYYFAKDLAGFPFVKVTIEEGF